MNGVETLATGEARGLLVGGTLTQLVASLGTPFAFDPPSGCVLFLDDVAERPYRLDRMLTQLRLSGILERAAAIVFNALPRCDEPRRANRARYSAARARGLSRRDPVWPAVRSHGRPDADPPVRRHRQRRRGSESIARHRGGGCSVNGMTRIHLIGVCGTAMATLAAPQEPGLRRPGIGPERLSADERLPARAGITTLQGYRAEHISADIDLVVVGNAISRGNPELEEVLDRKIRYCSLPEAVRDHFLWGRGRS